MTLSVPEITVALLGGTGSGKTTLLTRYNNFTPSFADQEYPYYVTAIGQEEAKELLIWQSKMKDRKFPNGTASHKPYHFHFRTSPTAPPLAQLTWYDYPGGWWNTSGLEGREEEARADLFCTFPNANVGMLLLDAKQLFLPKSTALRRVLDALRRRININIYEINDIRISADYVCRTLSTFADKLQGLDNMDIRIPLPRVWIIALSKADIVEEMIWRDLFTAEQFATVVLSTAEKQVDLLQNFFGAEFGKTFLLLSSCRGGGKSRTEYVDSYKETIGIELIAPLAFELQLLCLFRDITKSFTGKLGLKAERVLRSFTGNRWDILDLVDSLHAYVRKSPKVMTAKQIAHLCIHCFKRILEDKHAVRWHYRVGSTIQQTMRDELSDWLQRTVDDGEKYS